MHRRDSLCLLVAHRLTHNQGDAPIRDTFTQKVLLLAADSSPGFMKGLGSNQWPQQGMGYWGPAPHWWNDEGQITGAYCYNDDDEDGGGGAMDDERLNSALVSRTRVLCSRAN